MGNRKYEDQKPYSQLYINIKKFTLLIGSTKSKSY